jgi:DNA-binding MarR family transcriptional regulator
MGYWLKKSARMLDKFHDAKLQKQGLTFSQTAVLRELWIQDGKTQKQLQGNLELTPATISGVLDTLENKAFIVRKQDEIDSRVNRIYLTQEGAKLEKVCCQIIDEMEQSIAEGFSEDEVKIFIAWAKKIQQNICKESTKNDFGIRNK